MVGRVFFGWMLFRGKRMESFALCEDAIKCEDLETSFRIPSTPYALGNEGEGGGVVFIS